MTGQETEIPTSEELVEEQRPVSELPNTKFDRLMLVATTVVFCIMIALVMSQVLIRYVASYVGFHLTWTEEVARYLLIIVSFMGSAVAWRRRENISLSALTEMLPRKIAVPIDLFKDVTILLFVLFCAYSSYRLGMQMMKSPLGSIYAIKTGHLYCVLCGAFILIGIYMVRWIAVRVIDLINLFRSDVEEKAAKAGAGR